VVVAVADGLGLDLAELNQSGDAATVTMRLVEDLPVEGRIVDEEGKPLRGVNVLVRELFYGRPESVTRYLRTGDQAALRTCWGPLPGLPVRTITDADGQFRLAGVGRDRVLILGLEGKAITHTDRVVATRPATEVTNDRGIDGATFEYTAEAPRSIRGVVRDEKTRRPISGVRVATDYVRGPTAVTDQDGKYELTGCSPTTTLVLAQPVGTPYFACGTRVRFRPGRDAFVANFDLVAGLDLRGRVIDESTGKPPKQATVAYYPLYPNPHSRVLCNLATRVAPASAPVGADGSYRLAVVPGPGIVVVAASPRDSYAGAWLDEKAIKGHVGDCGKRCSPSWIPTAIGGLRDGFSLDRYSGVALINPAPDAGPQTVDLSVRPAPAIRGTIVGPDGQALAGVRVTGLTTESMAETLESATFQVEGLNPRATRELTFHHRESGLSAVVTVRGDQSEPLTVRLAPCGVVHGRLVKKSGQPVAGAAIGFYGRISGTEVITETDDDGRFRANLIAGPEYSVGLPGTYEFQKPISAVQVESGRDKNLGALRVID